MLHSVGLKIWKSLHNVTLILIHFFMSLNSTWKIRFLRYIMFTLVKIKRVQIFMTLHKMEVNYLVKFLKMLWKFQKKILAVQRIGLKVYLFSFRWPYMGPYYCDGPPKWSREIDADFVSPWCPGVLVSWRCPAGCLGYLGSLSLLLCQADWQWG